MGRFGRLLVLAIAMLLIADVAYGGRESSAEFKTDKAVLNAVVSLQCQGSDRGRVMLSSRPSAPDSTKEGPPPPTISNAQMADLMSRTGATDALPKGIECPRVHMVTYARIKAAFDLPAKHPMQFPVPPGVLIPIGANTAFKDTFPNIGILLRLSMPAYSPNKDMAIVYFSEDCGGLCAHGEYVVLRLLNGSWRVTKRLQAWTS
jgi:hypothetical protein